MRRQVFEGLSQFDYWLASDHINEAAAVISHPEMALKSHFLKLPAGQTDLILMGKDCFFRIDF